MHDLALVEWPSRHGGGLFNVRSCYQTLAWEVSASADDSSKAMLAGRSRASSEKDDTITINNHFDIWRPVL